MAEMQPPAHCGRPLPIPFASLRWVLLVCSLIGVALALSATRSPAQDSDVKAPDARETRSQQTDAKRTPATEGPGNHNEQEHQHQVIEDDPVVMKEALAALPEGDRQKAQKAWDRFAEMKSKLAAEMLKLRTIQLHYRNGYDQSVAATERYRQQRIAVWELMQEQFTYSLDLLDFLPSAEAISYVVTMVQHHIEHDIYDEETYRGASQLFDLKPTPRFIVLAAARSAVVTGKFEAAQSIYDSVAEEDLEDADRNLKYQLDILQEQWEREQQAIQNTDSNALPQVKFTTTQGDFIVELFADAAPSTVAHFLKLVGEGFYDGMDFSSVTQNILALTGDASGDGRGNSGEFLVDEHAREQSRPALRGSLTMAKMPLGRGTFIENSGSSQFAICYLPIPSMSDQQTIFGRVIEGMDVVSRLRRVDPSEKKEKSTIQLPPDAIMSSEILRPGKNLPEPVYVDMQAELEKAVEAGLIRRKEP